MKTRKSPWALLLPLLLTVTVSAPALDPGQVGTAFDAAAPALLKALPLSSGLGLHWSDAHIGNFPHMGVGIALETASVGKTHFEPLSAALGGGLPTGLIGGVTLEGRMGGFLLPFDLGLKLGFLPDTGFPAGYLQGKQVGLTTAIAGADIRLRVLREGVIRPLVSLGVGVGQGRGSLSLPTDAEDADFALSWKSTTVAVKGQASKSFLIVTPYLGAEAALVWSDLGYTLRQTVTAGETVATQSYSGSAGAAGQFQGSLFGGASFNLSIIKVDLNLQLGFPEATWGVTLGTRLQW
jgi:hypothetical protein